MCENGSTISTNNAGMMEMLLEYFDIYIRDSSMIQIREKNVVYVEINENIILSDHSNK